MAFRILFAVLLLLLLVGEASKVTSQEKPTSLQPYATENEVTVQGNIEQVNEYKCPVTGTIGSHLTVAVEGGNTEVHLAPTKFLKDYEITFKVGESVKIVGVKLTFDGKPAMLARSVSVGRETFIFRDSKGRPLW
jgi:DNA/RNA endonuclease YhcR with UshA esterase domain